MFRPLARPLLNGLMNILYPPVCFLCQRSLFPAESGQCVCPSCRASIEMNAPPFCLKCSRPLKKPARSFCRDCQRSSFHFDNVYAACRYSEPFQRLLHLYKYGNLTAVRKIFSSLMIEFIDTYQIPVKDYQLLLAVPLHPVRQRERGYNQSELLAAALARHYRIPFRNNILKRTLYSPNQARVSPKQRWTNVESAFKIGSHSCITNTNILLVDDLITTGATLSSLAGVLKAGGAKKVSALTAAIAE